jgi:hypothetical protein
MKRKWMTLFGWAALAAALALPCFGQTIPTSMLTGTVKDATGGVIPGAEVVVTDPGTGRTFNVLTDDNGYFAVASVPAGTYTVTVTVPGFKKAVIENVKVNVGVPASVSVTLEVGEISEQVIVTGGAEILNTTTASIGTTVDRRRIQELPLSSRDALDLTMLQAGVATTGNPRSSVVDGLRKASINITMDGINVQDNNLRSSDGYFTYIRPRIDAVEEFTITTSTAGAESSGGGAVNIRFVTRAGTNEHHGSAYYYHRNPALNANYYFNNLAGIPRTRILLHQWGVRQGGPIIKGKLFYFGNFEEFRLPDAQARTRTILNADARKGLFNYKGTDGVIRQINLLSLAGAAGYPSTIDPFLQKNYIDVLNSNATSGLVTNDLRTDLWSFNNTGKQLRSFPTARFDWAVTSKISWELIGNYNYFNSQPDFLNSMDRFGPGFNVQGSQKSNRWSTSTAVRYSITRSLTNEARYGMTGGTVQFFRDVPIPEYRLPLPIGSNPFTYQPSSSRNSPGFHIIDNLSWAKGKHFLSIGTEINLYRRWQETVSGTSQYRTLGMLTTDPADSAIFTAANFPAISTSDRDTARALYAMLVGRISGVSASVYADEKSLQYKIGAPLIDRYKQNEIGIFVQDTWRVLPSFTLNLGLRYQFLSVPDSLNKLAILPVGGYAGLWGPSGKDNLFKPGVLAGSPLMLDLAGGINGKPFYEDDWNNLAPAIGFSWQPAFSDGMLGAIFGGRGKSAIRGGYNIAYIRDGFFNVTGVVQQNTGAAASGNLTADVHFPAGSLMNRNPLPPLVVTPSSFSFPTAHASLRFSNSVAAFDPGLRTSYIQSWSFAIEREIMRDTVLEFRYVGNHGTKLWRRVNINEVNIFENGFLEEFKNARNNLAISRAAGKGANFRNQGLPGQVNLPIFSAVFGSPTSASFGSSTFVTYLDNGEAGRTANTFAHSSTYWNNLVAAGYAPNFWLANSDAYDATFAGNNGDSNYHSLQIELRRRFSNGVFAQANYTFGKSLANDAGNTTGTNSFYSWRYRARDYARTGYDIRQRLNLNFIWEPPLGTGRRFWSGGVLGKVFEGWQIGGIGRIQSGNPFELSTGRLAVNQFDSGVVLKGITRKDLQEMVGVYYDPPAKRVYYFPKSVIGDDGRANANYIAPQTTPGVWGERIILDGPGFVRFDISFVKKTYITEQVNFEFRAELFDAFNNINFLPPSAGILGTTFGQITSTQGAYRDVSTTNDPGARWIQFVLRLNW